MPDYKWFYKFTSLISQKSLGSVILIKSSIGQSIFLSQLSNENITCVILKNNNQSILAISAYLKSKNNIHLDISTLSKAINSYPALPLILGMDSNAHSPIWFNNHLDARGKALLDFFDSNTLHILNSNTGPTWESRSQSSTIDLSIVNNCLIRKVFNWKIRDECSLSDHKFIMFQFLLLLTIPTSQAFQSLLLNIRILTGYILIKSFSLSFLSFMKNPLHSHLHKILMILFSI